MVSFTIDFVFTIVVWIIGIVVVLCIVYIPFFLLYSWWEDRKIRKFILKQMKQKEVNYGNQETSRNPANTYSGGFKAIQRGETNTGTPVYENERTVSQRGTVQGGVSNIPNSNKIRIKRH